MTLEQYLTFKFGNNTSSLACIVYMLKASFMASSYRKFWQNWNPLWSFFLLFHLYKPLSKKLSQQIALFVTFTLSGFLHDCVAMLMTGKTSVVMTLSFSLAALIVMLEKKVGINLSKAPAPLKPLYHLLLITISALPVFVIFSL